jgi:hypothetical protein
MPDPTPPPYNLRELLAEIDADEKVDRAARRILTQEDIRRLVEETRRRHREANQETRPS